METEETVFALADRDLDELDDHIDRDELRQRYYGLLQELRVILPGVQVLVAFLLTVPFAQRFGELDRVERIAFAVATVSALFSVICLLTPTVFHRIADRTARVARLRWGIRLTVIGLGLLGVALVTALWCTTRFIYGTATALFIVTPVIVVIILLWFVLPLSVRRTPRPAGEHPEPPVAPAAR